MDKPINLDERRGVTARLASQARRELLSEFQADQSVRQRCLNVPEKLLVTGAAKSLPEAAATALHLLDLFAATPEAQETHLRIFIGQARDDLARLCDNAKEQE